MDTNTSLDFFIKQLFLEGYKEVMNTFLNNTSLKSKGYYYSSEYDCYILDLIYGEDPQNPIIEYDEIDRADFYKAIIKENCHNVYKFIINNHEHLTETLNKIKVLYNKSITKDDIHFKTISEQLYNLIFDLQITFPTFKHSTFNLLNKPERAASFFQYKDLSPIFFEKLYDISINLDLIDDVDTTEEMFYNVFTCSKPNADLKISFIKPNPIVAYFLKQIEVFFNNLNAVSIEKSECFYNKQGKLIKSTDLYTALSRGNEKNNDYYKKIDSYILPLKNQIKD